MRPGRATRGGVGRQPLVWVGWLVRLVALFLWVGAQFPGGGL